MGFFRFYRSFRIAPGIQFNLSKRGGSLSLGTNGATVNLSAPRHTDDLRHTRHPPELYHPAELENFEYATDKILE
jgi:hypothetical protein